MGFTVLYVCTGNVCRSPMAELLLRGWAAPEAGLTVASAGVAALVGQGIDRSTASALGQLGIDPTRHRARQFEPWMAAQADLVLTAERVHRDRVMTDVPAAFRRTFTMREFARLARHVRPGPPAEVVTEIAALRGADGFVPAEHDDMPDPYRGMIKQATSIAELVTTTVHATIDVLSMWPREVARPGEPVAVAAPSQRRARPLPQ